MLATTFGVYGVIGAAYLVSTVFLIEHGIRRTLERFGILGALALALPLSLVDWLFIEYGRPWTLHHFGEVGFIVGTALIATPSILFAAHTIALIVRRFGKHPR